MKALLAVLTLVSAQYSGAEVLATVGKAKITTDDFQKKLNDVRKQASNPPSPETYLEDLVRYEVGVQEAEKMKLADDPLVKERFKQVLYNSLLEKELGKKVEAIKVNDNELKDYYKKNPELHIAHILIDLKQNATAEEREIVKKRAMEILDDVKKSKRPFEELVKLYSDDSQTKEMGGDIGYQSRVSLLPAVYDVAVNMKDGEVKGLIETRYGFHIIKLIDRRGFDLADKQQIRAALFDVKRAKLFNDYFEKAKKGYKVEVNREALKTVK